MTKKEVNYSPELTTQVVEAYGKGETDDERKEILQSLSLETGKSVKSLTQKLVREQVYIKPKRVSVVTGDKPETKETIVHSIANRLNVSVKHLEGLEKATKKTLSVLRERIQAGVSES
jgi:hypothetical protein